MNTQAMLVEPLHFGILQEARYHLFGIPFSCSYWLLQGNKSKKSVVTTGAPKNPALVWHLQC
jgi:hypothetical protein